MSGLFRARPETLLVTHSERPALLDALALVEAVPVPAPAELRGQWARERIEAAGVEVKADSLVAIKALRKAEPGLSLVQAVALTKEAAALTAH